MLISPFKMAPDNERQNQTLAIAALCEQLRLPHVVSRHWVEICGSTIGAPMKRARAPGGWVYIVICHDEPVRDWYTIEGAVQCAVECGAAAANNNE